jgi:glycosyltransferase involved in cell wall biosynthesis
MLTIKPTIKIVATILAKNEADIIGLNIEHHINQGISQFIVTDNASTDGTRQIIEKYTEVVEIIDEPGNDHNQPKWVSHMAKLACKLEPDWIVHLDADELWCNLYQLRHVRGKVAGCERMYLHPPTGEVFDWREQRFYLDFDECNIPQESKVAHRSDPEIAITHGNHGVVNAEIEFTRAIYRHHYPVRSYEQWARKAEGNEALKRRNSHCVRWQNWYNLLTSGKLRDEYSRLTSLWRQTTTQMDHERFVSLMDFWATPEMVDLFQKNPSILPIVREWPRQ